MNIAYCLSGLMPPAASFGALCCALLAGTWRSAPQPLERLDRKMTSVPRQQIVSFREFQIFLQRLTQIMNTDKITEHVLTNDLNSDRQTIQLIRALWVGFDNTYYSIWTAYVYVLVPTEPVYFFSENDTHVFPKYRVGKQLTMSDNHFIIFFGMFGTRY